MARGSDASYEVGLVGLAVMGANLALNIESRGYGVAVYNRTWNRTRAFVSERGQGKRLLACESVGDLVRALSRPRRIVLMVQAGAPVDAVIGQLAPLLEPGDILADGGNSLFKDTIRREKSLADTGIRLVGMGVSGGEEGALHGPSIMPGGDAAAYAELEPVLSKIAARTEDGPCVTHVGKGGAGHFVKMVHNGIEYGDMQLIAEAYDLLRTGFGLNAAALHEVLARWNEGPLKSYLIEITADILDTRDPDDGRLVLDQILDSAGQKGTGRWTATTALELSTPIPTITAAVDARFLSAMKDQRMQAPNSSAAGEIAETTDVAAAIDDVEQALYASKVCSYAQGMALLRQGDAEYGFGLNMAEIARIWKGGCIIRAALLDSIRSAFLGAPRLANLLMTERFSAELRERDGGWRRTVRRAIDVGVPMGAMSASLAYYDAFHRRRLPAALIQAQRDYFGAHTYLRTDVDGVYHTEWTGSKRTHRVS